MRVDLRQVTAAPALERPREPSPARVYGHDGRDLLLPALAPRRHVADDTVRLVRVDASLARIATHLRKIQEVDGRWDTLYRGGNFQLAISAVALADVGASPEKAREREVIAHFATAQLADGGFSVFPGEPADAAATRMVVSALEVMAKRQPALATTANAIADKGRSFLASTPKTPGDGIYALLANLVSDLVSASSDLVPNPPFLAALIRLASKPVASTISGIARIYVPAFALLMEAQARKASWSARAAGPMSDALLKRLEHEIVRTQDADGAWAWTALGTALCMMALKRQGHTLESSPVLRRGAGFLERLRGMDVTGWTRGDAWDTAYATLTLPAIDPESSAVVAKGVDALLHGQLEDGRFSFSILGILGDDDTSSVTLRAMCARYAATDDVAERQRLHSAIAHTAEGLVAFQRSEGGWGAFNKRSLPFISGKNPPGNPTISAFNDVQSPDLSARVLRSLIDAERSGALTGSLADVVRKSIAKARTYLEREINGDASWWSRWTLGGLSSFAYVVPALRHAGVAADAKTLEGVSGLLRAKQNADGGWGEEPAADRAARRAGDRGRSSVSHTASAIIGLIGTAARNDDAQVNTALAHAVDYLLRQDNDGLFSNGRHVYTQLTGLDYYDCDNWTTCLAASALQLYRDYQRVGAAAAMERFAL